MKAIVYQKYGTPEVLKVKEVQKPTPKSDEVLIKLKASTATAPDTEMRKGMPYIGRLYTGIKVPKRSVPGYDFAGTIEATGENVSKFKIGDQVFGGSTKLGGYAEYTCISENDFLLKIPTHLSFEEVVPMSNSAVTALNFLKKGNIGPGQKILVNGASGGVGTYAVQLAKYFGAEVTAVCSAGNIALVKSLGATRVINYKEVDFTKTGNKFDIIFDAVGTTTYRTCKRLLTSHGTYLSVTMSLPLLGSVIWTSFFGSKKAKVSATGALSVNNRLNLLKEVTEIAEKKEIKAVIDRVYSLNKIVEAHRYVDTGRKVGNIIITI